MTDGRRVRPRAGPRTGTRLSASVRLARTMRWATVASETRNARAISSVVRPPSRRSVSATRASVERTGWHAVNTRRKRSSPTSSSIAASRSGAARSCCGLERTADLLVLPLEPLVAAQQIDRPMLRGGHEPGAGLLGTPDSGHCSSAATRASCASSSATPTSRTIRARPAMSRADSILQTASIARWISEAVMTTDSTIFESPLQAGPNCYDSVFWPACA